MRFRQQNRLLGIFSYTFVQRPKLLFPKFSILHLMSVAAWFCTESEKGETLPMIHMLICTAERCLTQVLTGKPAIKLRLPCCRSSSHNFRPFHDWKLPTLSSTSFQKCSRKAAANCCSKSYLHLWGTPISHDMFLKRYRILCKFSIKFITFLKLLKIKKQNCFTLLCVWINCDLFWLCYARSTLGHWRVKGQTCG